MKQNACGAIVWFGTIKWETSAMYGSIQIRLKRSLTVPMCNCMSAVERQRPQKVVSKGSTSLILQNRKEYTVKEKIKQPSPQQIVTIIKSFKIIMKM